jgi:hypothetical protein
MGSRAWAETMARLEAEESPEVRAAAESLEELRTGDAVAWWAARARDRLREPTATEIVTLPKSTADWYGRRGGVALMRRVLRAYREVEG